MTKYVANENGDWWEVVEGESLYLIDTANPDITKAMEEEDTNPYQDKFEYFIKEYGVKVGLNIGEEVEGMSELITIATFCQEAECDKDIEVSAILYMPANRVEYICSYCGVGQGQDNWLEGAGV